MFLFPEFSFQILNFLHYFVQLWISIVMGITTSTYDNPPEVHSVGYFLVHVFFKLKFIDKAYDCSFNFWVLRITQVVLDNTSVGLVSFVRDMLSWLFILSLTLLVCLM